MSRKSQGTAAFLCAGVLAGTLLSGCAGPSTRVLPSQEYTGNQQELPEENQILEAVNPFYLQESLQYLTGYSREPGSMGEEQAVGYMEQLLTDYGYVVQTQSVPFSDGPDRPVRQGVNLAAVKPALTKDADILIISTSHGSAAGSPGASVNASGTATFLECARLLSQLSADTEIRFVSFCGGSGTESGSRFYADSLSEEERRHIIGAIHLDALGYAGEPQIILGTADGKETLLGNLLKKYSFDLDGVDEIWQYTIRDRGDYIAFLRGQIPAVMIGQERGTFEAQTSADRLETIDVEQMAHAAEVTVQTAADLMSFDTPSQWTKSRFMNPIDDQAWVFQKTTALPFGADFEAADAAALTPALLVSSVTDGAGKTVDTYQYRGKWFGVDQIILTNYHYSDGKLETISLDADAAGVDFDDMKERISSWYGTPVSEESGPAGTGYEWNDPVCRRSWALIPTREGYEVEVREFVPEPVTLGMYQIDGTVLWQESPDTRTARVMELVGQLIAPDDAGLFSNVTMFTDGIDGIPCFLVLPEEGEPGNGALWIDLEDVFQENGDWRDWTGFVKRLMICYGQVLARTEETFVAEYGTMFEETPDPAAFANDFMQFILFEEPDGTSASEKRIRFFYGSEAFVTRRNQIRAAFLSENGAQRAEMEPEG